MSDSSIWPRDRTLSGATTLGQNGPWSNGIERVLQIVQCSRTGASPSDCLMSYPGHLLAERLLLCRDAVCEFCNILIHGCMQIHIQPNKDERTQFFRKIYLSLGSKGLQKILLCKRWVGDWTELQHIDPPTLLAIAAFLYHSPGLLNRGPGSHSSIFSPTDLNFLSPGLYNNLMHTYFLQASHLYSSQPIDSQGYPLSPDIFDRMHLLFTQVHFSSDSPARSEVNMLHILQSQPTGLNLESIFKTSKRLNRDEYFE